ncbi:hypothetical protein ACLKA6_016901 [Drosophila palustris]
MSDAAEQIVNEIDLATSAYRSSAVTKNPFGVRRPAPVADSFQAMATSPSPAKRQCNEAPFKLYIFGIKDIGNFIDDATSKVGNSFRSRLGAKGAIIFSCQAETTFKAIEDLAQDQGLRSMSEDQVLRPKLTVSVCGLPPSINTNWVAGKIKALGFSPLNVTNIVGNISGRPTRKFRVELDHHENNDSFLKLATLGSFEVTIDKLHKRKPVAQCFRCQGYNHISSDCISPNFVCCKCAGPHDTRSCLITTATDLKFANCGEGHKANWDGCPAFLDVLKNSGDQDLPPAAQDLPPAAQDMSPGHHLPPVDHVPPSEVSVYSSDLEYDLNEAGDLIKIK